MDAAAVTMPNEGAVELVSWLKDRHVETGIITRNSVASVERSLENFPNLKTSDFAVVITRDTDVAPKPSGDGIVWAAEQLRVAPAQALMVGDFIFDFQSGRAAGALTAMLDPVGSSRLRSIDCDFRIQRLDQLRSIIRTGLPHFDAAASRIRP
jgi:phosphoglycolate phosphatase-like HAD superfamily hydrolase